MDGWMGWLSTFHLWLVILKLSNDSCSWVETGNCLIIKNTFAFESVYTLLYTHKITDAQLLKQEKLTKELLYNRMNDYWIIITKKDNNYGVKSRLRRLCVDNLYRKMQQNVTWSALSLFMFHELRYFNGFVPRSPSSPAKSRHIMYLMFLSYLIFSAQKHAVEGWTQSSFFNRNVFQTGGEVRSDRWHQPLRPAAHLQLSGRPAAGGGEDDGYSSASDDQQDENNRSREGRGHSAQNQTGCRARHVPAHEEIRFAPFMSPSYRLQMDLLTHRLVLSYQGCHPSLKMPTCVVFTPKIGWFWMMSDTEVTSRWLSKGSRPLPSPLLRSLARTIPSRPCSLLSSCCGVTRPMCPSLLVDWLTHEVRKAEEGGRRAEGDDELKQNKRMKHRDKKSCRKSTRFNRLVLQTW